MLPAVNLGWHMKKNKLSLWLAGFGMMVLAASVVAAGCQKREIKNIDSGGATIVCFGDSMTFGYGVAPGEDYPSRLSEMLSMPVINSGIDGDSSPEALKRIQADALDRNPLLVIVEFGGNDFLRKIPLDVTVSNISQMVDMIQQKGAMCAIVDISSGMFFGEYRKAFGRIAKEKGALFVPAVLNGIITNPQMKSDFLHPNASGYRMIAERVHKEVAPYIRQHNAAAAEADK